MTKKIIWIWLICLVSMAALFFLTPASQPVWFKPVILLGCASYQLLLLTYFSKIPRQDKDTFHFGLTEKLYGLTIMAAFTLYTIGIWLVTPDTDPAWIKHTFLGLGLLLLLSVLLFFACKRVPEKPDDRLYTNLAKAACLTLCLILISLLILSLMTFFFPLTVTAGMILIYNGLMMFIFDLAFFFFEKRGG